MAISSNTKASRPSCVALVHSLNHNPSKALQETYKIKCSVCEDTLGFIIRNDLDLDQIYCGKCLSDMCLFAENIGNESILPRYKVLTNERNSSYHYSKWWNCFSSWFEIINQIGYKRKGR